MTEPPEKATDNLRAGIFWMLTTTLMFVLMDTCVKVLVANYPTLQVVWGRYFFQVVILCIVLSPRLFTLIRTQSLWFQLLRSIFLLGATLFFFKALNTLQVAEATAVMFTAPLIVTVLAPLVLKEKVGIRRWISVLVGFAGALIIVRPGAGTVDIGALWALGGAACYGCYQVSTRAMSLQDPVLTTLFYSALLGAIIMSIIVPFHFVMPDAAGWGLMVAAGGFASIGHFSMIKAFTVSEATKIAPFSYTNLIWATIIGFALFGTLPDLWTYVGAGIIVISGLYISHREHQRRKSAVS